MVVKGRWGGRTPNWNYIAMSESIDSGNKRGRPRGWKKKKWPLKRDSKDCKGGGGQRFHSRLP